MLNGGNVLVENSTGTVVGASFADTSRFRGILTIRKLPLFYAGLAQLVEHRTENPYVPSSILGPRKWTVSQWLGPQIVDLKMWVRFPSAQENTCLFFGRTGLRFGNDTQ